MKVSKKQSVSLILVVTIVLAIVLGGCGSNPGGESAATATASGSNTQAVSSGTDSNSVVTPIELSLFVNMSWFWMDSWGGRPVDDEITKETGVSFNVTKATDEQQLPILIASNDLPDLVYTDSLFKELSNDNISYEIGDLINKYAPDFKPPIEQVGPALTSDNKYYYLVNFWKTQKDWEDPHFLPSVGEPGYNYRTDIMQELGNPPLKTTDDLVNVLTKVHEKYPKMVPLALGPEGDHYELLINQSKVASGLASQPDGSWKFYGSTKEYKDGMKFMNQLAQKGLLKPEMFTLKYDQYVAEAQAGNVFMWKDDASNISLYNETFKKNGSNATTAMMQTNLFGDKQAPTIDPSSGWAGTFITKKCKDPERAIKFMQWASSDAAGKLVGWGLPEKQYTEDAQGYPVLTADTAASWAKDYDATVEQTGVGAWYFGTKAWFESVRSYDPNSNKALTDFLLERKNNIVVRPETAKLVPEPNSEEATISANLENLVKTMYARIIFAKNDAEFEKAYNELQSQLDNNGRAKYEAWAATKWAEIKKIYNIN